MILYPFVLIPVAAGAVLYFFKRSPSYVIILLQAALFVYGLFILDAVKNGGEFITTLPLYPQHVGIALKASFLSAPLLLMTVLFFSLFYLFTLKDDFIDGRFNFLYLTLEGLLCGIFLANDIFNIYVLIEVATIIVSILLMYKKHTLSLYDGLLYLMVNIAAMTFFLFGIAMIYRLTGVLDMDLIAERLLLVEDKRSLILPFTLLTTGAVVKSAVIPVFGWLPRAHGTPGAPVIVSALLSGLYIKQGVFLFIRLQGLFGEVLQVRQYFFILGIITMMAGVLLALGQRDIKLLLAYSTISQIGLIMTGINTDSLYAYTGGVYHIYNHAFFKSALFLTAGLVADHYGTREVGSIRGLHRTMPYISVIIVIAVLGVTGAPLLNGSVSKSLITKGLEHDVYKYMIYAANTGTIVYFMRYMQIIFGKTTVSRAKILFNQKIAIGFLAGGCFIGGLFATGIIEFLFGIRIQLSVAEYIGNLGVFLASIAAAYVIYRFGVQKTKLFERIGQLDLSFNAIVMMIGLFFAATAAYLHFSAV